MDSKKGWARDAGKRWEEGIDHHPKSEALFKFIADQDFKQGDGFGFKSGGDGDNGEHLMYLMDMYFEREEYDPYEEVEQLCSEDKCDNDHHTDACNKRYHAVRGKEIADLVQSESISATSGINGQGTGQNEDTKCHCGNPVYPGCGNKCQECVV